MLFEQDEDVLLSPTTSDKWGCGEPAETGLEAISPEIVKGRPPTSIASPMLLVRCAGAVVTTAQTGRR
ncbi:hypothetical protein C9I56_35085 [Paraburkholderia caribensis]|nr:hypothetical protein C9I56_35085 [Paraburkholderia caribensis]